jgi:hypothetical protein
MFCLILRVAVSAIAVAGLPMSNALAHCFVGERFFPATLVTDDNLHASVIDLGLPDFFNHLIPLVEVSFQTPVANNFGNSYVTTGFVSPGVIWVATYDQVGLEAIIPVNKGSGSGVGVIGQLHLYLDDIFPNTYGQPLIGGRSSPAKLPFGG